jgi:hypothetical protein
MDADPLEALRTSGELTFIETGHFLRRNDSRGPTIDVRLLGIVRRFSEARTPTIVYDDS